MILIIIINSFILNNFVIGQTIENTNTYQIALSLIKKLSFQNGKINGQFIFIIILLKYSLKS